MVLFLLIYGLETTNKLSRTLYQVFKQDLQSYGGHESTRSKRMAPR